MAVITRFEDIEAWQKSRELTRNVYAMTRDGTFARDFALRDQIRRAAVSVMANIAEGFERGGDRELQQFLATAKGSVGEVKSHLYVALDAGFIQQDQFDSAYQLANHITHLIGAFHAVLAAISHERQQISGQLSHGFSPKGDQVHAMTLDSGRWTLDSGQF